MGLCENGLVKDVPRGTYTKSKSSKGYALAVWQILMSKPEAYKDPEAVWAKVAPGRKEKSELKVVFALFNHDLLEKTAH